ncbi:hypothetical protein [Pseudonocardia sp. GCM10023141]|uniref:hypothetical protein n=1 Tax=Pseudonocardia sp. GCM10023141 TaxID=3252653 RepID=UPI0036165B30
MPDRRLLRATTKIDDIVDIDYFIDEQCGAPREMISIALFTFIQLDLRQFFVQEAYDEIGDLAIALDNEFDSGGTLAVAGFLATIRDSCSGRHGYNHWRSALYEALADSADFCAGGFRQLLPGATIF